MWVIRNDVAFKAYKVKVSASTMSDNEDGELEGSPFEIHKEDAGEFQSGAASSEFVLRLNGSQGHDHDEEEVLDDTLTHNSEEDPQLDLDLVVREQSGLSLSDQDLISDEMWVKQQEILRQNEEKRALLFKQLEHKKQLNELLLKQEQERKKLADMEKQVDQLEQKR